jgi:ABC-type nitrate/sulfonate/bicarbonate transport system permease component
MSELVDAVPRPAGPPPEAGGPRLARRRVLPRGAEAAILFALVLAAWQVGTALARQEGNALLPAPVVTARALWGSLPELLRGTWSSLLILVPGWTLAVVLGIAVGLVVGTTDVLRRAFFPFARVAAPVPPTVYIPYAIAVLPTFRLSAVFVVFVGGFWPVFLNTAAGALALDARHRDSARVLELRGIEYLWRVVLPGALPHVFSGMAVALALSFVLLTVAELFGANAGLGRFVQYYADYADYPRMVAGILYTGLVTFLAMELLDRLKHRLLFWVR